MVFNKNFVLLASILAILAIGAQATDLIVGQRVSGDSVVCYDNVHLPAQPGKIVTATRTCSGLPYGSRITRIEAKDTGRVGYGGYATIQSGGVYYNTVTLYLWSQPGQPLDFSLNVYAKQY